MTYTTRTFGVDVQIETDISELLDRIDLCLPACPTSGGGTAPRLAYHVRRTGPHASSIVVVRNRRAIARVADVDEACHRLVRDAQASIGRLTPRFAWLHAGVVAVGGRALVLPGRSGTGKTTLVEALVGAGAQYGSDEFAIVDDAGRVYPYPRALGRKSPDHHTTWIRASHIGATTMEPARPAAAVVFTAFEPGAELRPTLLTPASAALRLIGSALAARGLPDTTLRSVRALLSGATAFASTRGEAADAALHLLDLVSQPRHSKTEDQS